jgi:hypothetical protein
MGAGAVGIMRIDSHDSFADAIEVFPGDAAPGAFRFGNDLLLDMMIDPRSEASLLSRLDRRTGGKIHGVVQAEPALTVDQVSLPLHAFEALFLTLPACQRDEDAAWRQRLQADLGEPLEATDPLVIGDRLGLEHLATGFLTDEAFRCLADGARRPLREQSELGTDFGRDRLVDRRLAEHARLQAGAGRESGRFIEPLHGPQQSPARFGAGDQLPFDSEFHHFGAYQSVTYEAAGARRAGSLFPCRLKAAVSEVQVL